MPLNIRIRSRTAERTPDSVIVCGNSDYTVTFSFDSEWNAFSVKTAVFRYRRNGVTVTERVQFSGNVCAVPVLADTDEVFVGVEAGSIRTAAPARIPCARCITDFPSAAYTPPEDVFNEIMEAIASHVPPVPTVTVMLLRDANGFALRDSEGFALRVEG